MTGEPSARPARVVLVDAPWAYRSKHLTRQRNKMGIGVAGRYTYGVMDEAALCALGPLIRAVCADDAYLFSWATRPNLDRAIRVLEAWGFEYVTAPMTWVKTYPSGALFRGPGRYTFSNPEDVLLGRLRGTKCWHPKTGYRPEAVIQAPHPRANGKIIHSRKPEQVQDALDRWLRPSAGDAAFLELFATREREGWTCLGYDVTGNCITEDLARLAATMATSG